MKRAYDRFKANGDISADAYQYAVAKGYSPETIEKLKQGLQEKVRQSRASLHIQGAPLRFKPSPKAANPTDPTPEWIEKAGSRIEAKVVGRGEVVAQKRFKLRGVIEQYGKYLTPAQKAACERLVYDSAYVLRVKIANHEPSGGGTPNKLGGLGNVQPHVRHALARHEWVRGFLSTEALITARRLVTCELSRNDGAPLTLEEFSASVQPDVIQAGRRWGFAMGALWVLAGQLVHLYAICPHTADEWSDRERDAELGYEPRKRNAIYAT